MTAVHARLNMLLHELPMIVTWWLGVLLIGWAAFPLAWKLFPTFPDRGHSLAKPLGLLLWGYVLWLGATVGALHNTLGGVLAALIVVMGLSYLMAKEAWHKGPGGSRPLIDWLRANKKNILFGEGLFLAAYLFWALVRAHSPDIATAGGEKFMEIAFINGILTSLRFPPHDPWLAGYAISYYYFGYVMIAGLVTLTHVPSSVGFNLAGATWFALTFTAAYGVARGLIARLGRRNTRVWGLLAALVLTLMGNLEGVLEVLYARQLLPVGFWQWLDIRNINAAYPPNQTASWVPQRFIWWWQASRVLHDKDLLGNTMEVIDEFPAFSFILGDMHPHVLGLPFVLLVIGLAWSLLTRARPTEPRALCPRFRAVWERLGQHFTLPDLLLYSLALGALAFLNTWDFPIYWALVVGVLLLRGAREEGGVEARVRAAIGPGVALALLGLVLYLPFYIGFQSQAGGILPNLFNPTRFPQFFVMFGPLLVLLGLFFLLHMRGERGSWREFVPWLVGVWLFPWVFLALMVGVGLFTPMGQSYLKHLLSNPQVQAQVGGRSLPQLLAYVFQIRLRNPWTALILGVLLAWALYRLWQQVRDPDHSPARSDAFVLLLFTLGLLLTYAVEFVYIKDLFGTRMNTVFKFYFQTWVLWALGGVYALAQVSQKWRGGSRALALSMAGLFIALGLIYSLLAIPARSELKQAGVTLDGEAWIARVYPDDYAGIRWLRGHTPPDTIILEAPGGSYSFHGRMAAFTGRATLMGWDFHELQWRGDALARQAGTRVGDAERIYKQARGEELLNLLHSYDVAYLIIGPLERQKYGITPVREKEFQRTLDLRFEQGALRVYRVP